MAAGLTAVGTFAAPGIGFLAAGPVVAALAGGGAGAATGGLIGALVGAGFTEHEAKMFAERAGDGAILVGVHAHDDRADRAREVLETAGAARVG